MSSVNKVTLIGRLGADPEIRYTQSGQPVGNLRLATSDNWNDRDGNRQERTEWHAVTVWGKQAELCGQYLAKGRQVYVEGRLQSREYTDREGMNRRVWEVVASQIVFLGARGDGPQGGGGGWGGGPQGGGSGQSNWGGSGQGGSGQGGGGQGGGGGWGGGPQGGGGGGGSWGGGPQSGGGGWGGSQGGGGGNWGGGNTDQGQTKDPGDVGGPGPDDDPIPF